MIDITVEKLAEVQSKLKETPERVNLVLARAINRATTAFKTSVSKDVRERYNVKANVVKASFGPPIKATSRNPIATIKSTGKRINLENFDGLTPKILFPGNSDYRVKILKSGGLKKVPGFAAGQKNDKWGLFRRTGDKRMPIQRLTGPDVPEMIGNKEVMDQLEKDAQATLVKRIDAELNYELNVRGKK